MDPFRFSFLMGGLGVSACLAVRFLGGEAGERLLEFPLGLGGLIATAIALAVYVSVHEDEPQYSQAFASKEEYYLLAAASTPLALVWLCMCVFQLLNLKHEIVHTWALIFFCIPMWFILVCTVEGLAGGLNQFLDTNARGHWSFIPISLIFLVFIACIFFFS